MADDDIVLTEYFKEVRVIDEATEKLDIIKELVENKDDDDPFYICDIGDIVQKYENLVLKMPRVVPFYAVKCNPDPTVLKAMAAMNASYDCASQREIASVMENGVTGDQIIFANTAKMNSHMIFAKRVGVEMLTVDGEPELHKIKSVFPEAKIVIRFRCDSASSGATFSKKFGCDAVDDAPKLVKLSKEMGLNIHGFCFHVGTQSADPDAFARGIKICVGLIEYSRSLGFKDANLIDIGGGFPDEDGLVSIDKFAEVINKALENVDPSIKVISEPGRYVVTSAITLATFILGKNIAVDEENETRYTYYINDGLFNSFMTKMMQIQEFLPIPMTLFRESSTGDAKCSTIYGQTATKGDCVVEDCLLPELNVGEMLIWPKKGAYALAGVRKVFNIPRPIVFHYAKKSFWAQHKSVFQYNLKKKMIEC